MEALATKRIMSVPPADLKLELKDVLLAVTDVTEWYELGLQLSLPLSILDRIAADPDFNGHKRMMLHDWLQYDDEATWEKLAAALTKIGKKAIATNIRRQFLGLAPESGAGAQEDAKQVVAVNASDGVKLDTKQRKLTQGQYYTWPSV